MRRGSTLFDGVQTLEYPRSCGIVIALLKKDFELRFAHGLPHSWIFPLRVSRTSVWSNFCS